jgi:hypothetical protein
MANLAIKITFLLKLKTLYKITGLAMHCCLRRLKQPWQQGNLFSRPLLTTGRRVTLGAKPTVPAGSDRRGPSHQATPAERGSWAGTSPADPTQPMGVRCVRGRSRSTTLVICVIRYKSSCVTLKLGYPGFELRPRPVAMPPARISVSARVYIAWASTNAPIVRRSRRAPSPA